MGLPGNKSPDNVGNSETQAMRERGRFSGGGRMRTIAVVNQKGGSAKTTTSVNLAATLAENGRRVLLIDLDPQHSATAWYDVVPDGQGVFAIFANPDEVSLGSLISETTTPGVSVAPSSAWLT